jgi:hypothetical protein
MLPFLGSPTSKAAAVHEMQIATDIKRHRGQAPLPSALPSALPFCPLF